MMSSPKSELSRISPKIFYAVLIFICVCSLLSSFFWNHVWAWSLGLLYVAYDTGLLFFIFFKTFNLRPQSVLKTSLPSIAVIIPARNEASVIAKCLDAVLAQRITVKMILIADDGSTDDSPQQLQRLYDVPQQGHGLVASSTYTNLSVLRLPHQGKAHALNAAWPLLDADIVVTLDADTILAPNALYALTHAFAQQPSLVAAGGVLEPRCASRWSSRFFEFFQRFEYIYSFIARAAWMKINALLLVSGAFAAYRKEVLQQLNGFDPESMVEDYEINHRLYRYAYDHQLNWTIGVVSGAYAVTDAPATTSKFFHQRRRWFAGFLDTQFANQDMTVNAAFGVIGRVMLPIKAVDTIQPILGMLALAVLIYLILVQSPALSIILIVILVKLGLDFLFNIWGLFVYHRWTSQPLTIRLWLQVLLYTVLTPFSFQWLRHIGACLGWWSYLTKQLQWNAQRDG